MKKLTTETKNNEILLAKANALATALDIRNWVIEGVEMVWYEYSEAHVFGKWGWLNRINLVNKKHKATKMKDRLMNHDDIIIKGRENEEFWFNDKKEKGNIEVINSDNEKVILNLNDYLKTWTFAEVE